MPRVLEKKERSLGIQLSIRGDRAESPKRAVIRKPYRPGQHGKNFRRRSSEFGKQLQEKQKIKFSYGVTDRQLKKIFKDAAKNTDSAIAFITTSVESRLDNVVMRLGLVQSRSIARQAVLHGYFLVNGRQVKTSSYAVSIGDVVSIKPSSSGHQIFQNLKERLKNYEVPVWLSLNKETLEGRVESAPKDVDFPFDISLIVDYYSKR